MEEQLKQNILKYLNLQKESYEKTLNNKLLNNRMIKNKYKDAREQVQTMLDEVTKIIKQVEELK